MAAAASQSSAAGFGPGPAPAPAADLLGPRSFVEGQAGSSRTRGPRRPPPHRSSLTRPRRRRRRSRGRPPSAGVRHHRRQAAGRLVHVEPVHAGDADTHERAVLSGADGIGEVGQGGRLVGRGQCKGFRIRSLGCGSVAAQRYPRSRNGDPAEATGPRNTPATISAPARLPVVRDPVEVRRPEGPDGRTMERRASLVTSAAPGPSRRSTTRSLIASWRRQRRTAATRVRRQQRRGGPACSDLASGDLDAVGLQLREALSVAHARRRAAACLLAQCVRTSPSTD